MKNHYYLISGKVSFVNPDDNQSIAWSEHNTTIAVNEPKIAAHDIGRAQQALQMVLHNRRTGEEPLQIVDVFLLSVSYLGEMSQEEFMAGMDQPEGKPN